MALPLKVQKNTASRNLTGVPQKKQCCQAKYLSKSKLKTCFFLISNSQMNAKQMEYLGPVTYNFFIFSYEN